MKQHEALLAIWWLWMAAIACHFQIPLFLKVCGENSLDKA
jgi:hypothetical protein